jgi:L-lactate dehydrogenase (cytochrome)
VKAGVDSTSTGNAAFVTRGPVAPLRKRLFRTDTKGEIATTRAAANQGILQVLSHVASKSLQDVLDARQKGQQVGWQLYVDNDRYVTPPCSSGKLSKFKWDKAFVGSVADSTGQKQRETSERL